MKNLALLIYPPFLDIFVLVRPVYSCDFVRDDCHPGVFNKPMTVCATRYPLTILCSLFSTYLIVPFAKHKIANVNRALGID